MSAKLVAFLICLSIVQTIKAEILDQTSCNLKTQQLRSELEQAASKAQFEISAAYSIINVNIQKARLNIQTKKNELENKANQVLGSTAQLCKNNLNLELSQLNDQSFNLCYYNADLNQLRQEVNQINGLKGVSSQVCGICGLESSCVNAKIEDIRSQAKIIQDEISVGVAEAKRNSDKCTQAAENSQLEIISKASQNFDSCVTGV